MTELSRRQLLVAGGAALVATASAAKPAQATGLAAMKITGTPVSALKGFDSAMTTFMTERGITNGQLAVARGGKLMLARGYTNGGSVTTQPTSLFRIASVSKHITATAIMRLAQEGKLSLGAKVASLLGLPTTADPRLADVTIWRLLQHTGGWDRDDDPMFKDATISKALSDPLPVSQESIITYVTGRKLDFAPGSSVGYSNFGYMLLGQVIEKISGMPYATYVHSKLLSPLGIDRMRLGQTLTRADDEVTYDSSTTGTNVMDTSGSTVKYPYGAFNLENMAANGGWIASAVDLVRFELIFDKPSVGILDATSIGRMFAVPETGVNAGGWYYGAGWQVRPLSGGKRNTWHTGSLPGNYSIVVRRYDGITFAALFNRRQEGSAPSFSSIDPLLYQAASAVTLWPIADRFSTYF
ncbi:serine hydrolase domain-containing protein [Nonomuraea sp. NPDC046802]|uniref:serine hydrolase domain-containing protein n=1 Tax=Nonomuraea sp. NPDC046802 TaxID=3154919 RepID=UPI0033E2C68D